MEPRLPRQGDRNALSNSASAAASGFLRAFLEQHREELPGKHPVGLRTIAKLAAGSDQRGFNTAPIQMVIAVSDKGKIKRLGDWKEPSEPFRVFVTKADLVPDKIGQELKQHRKSANIMNAESAGKYGWWSMKALEVEQVAEFLAERHVGRSGASPSRSKRAASNRNRRSSRDKPASTGHSAKAICKHCDSKDLTARSGRYGYYWRCGSVGQIRGQALGVPFVKGALTCGYAVILSCPGRDLNPHALEKQRILSPPCLPIPPPGQDGCA